MLLRPTQQEAALNLGMHFWAVSLTTGALLFLGSCGTRALFARWRAANAMGEDELELTNSRLHVGIRVQIEGPAREAASGRSQTAIGAAVCGMSARTLTLCIESSVRLPDETLQVARHGVPLSIRFVSDTGSYRFDGRVLRVDLTNPGRLLLIVRRPLWLARVQRRRFFRTPLGVPASLAIIGSVNAVAPRSAMVDDMSGNGFSAIVGAALGPIAAADLESNYTVGSTAIIRLPIASLRELPLHASVKSVRRIATRGGIGVQIACEFLPMSHPEQELLVQALRDVDLLAHPHASHPRAPGVC